MKNLIKPENTKKYLMQKGITAKKGYGQNFLIDESVLNSIIEGSGIDKNSLVLEIGPGMGTLTQALCEKAGYVAAVEIDRDMIKYLDENLDGFENVTVINDDILKVNLRELYNSMADKQSRYRIQKAETETATEKTTEKTAETTETTTVKTTTEKTAEQTAEQTAETLKEKEAGFSVVANLPYYITTPIIMQLLESGINIFSITVMVQKEVADRMKAAAGSKDYGALSLAVQYYAKAYEIVKVPGSSFIPRPDVESAVIKLVLRDNRREVFNGDQTEKIILSEASEKKFFILVKAAFSQRRKTFVNAVSNSKETGLSKEEIKAMLYENGYDENIRGERLSVYDYAKLADYICRKKMKN